MAAKRTHELIPLCHQLNLTAVAVEIEPDARAARPAHRHRGAAARPHRRRDGGAGRRVGGGAHHLRHVQGRRPRHGGDGRAPAREERRAQRHVAARRPTPNRAEARSEPAHRGRPRRLGQRRRREGRAQGARGVDHPGRRARRRGRRARRPLAPPGEPAGQREHREDEGRLPDGRARAPSARTSPPRASCVYELPVGARLYAGETPARGHADRQGVPRPLRDLPPGRRLRDAARGHLRARPRGRRDPARQRHRAAQAEPHRGRPCSP